MPSSAEAVSASVFPLMVFQTVVADAEVCEQPAGRRCESHWRLPAGRARWRGRQRLPCRSHCAGDCSAAIGKWSNWLLDLFVIGVTAESDVIFYYRAIEAKIELIRK